MSITTKPTKVHYESMPAKTILNPVKAPSMPFDWSINPYRGCQHGCSFCYARSTHSFLGVDADDTFQNHIFMKSDAPNILRAQIVKRLRGNKRAFDWEPIAIGTATDPYQQIEGKAMITRGCLEVLAEFQIPVSITTRSPLILRDLDLLQKLPIISINISISTLNNTIWRQFEPSTPSPAQRLLTVERLMEQGVPTGVFVAPILPFLTDKEDDLQELIEAAVQAGAGFIMPSYLRLSTSAVKVWFFQTLSQHYPQLTERYAKLYQHSAYAPSTYRDPVMRKVEALLLQYKLNTHKFVTPTPKASTLSDDSDESQNPVQLTLF
jgi:DNA repair photolyase